MMVDGKAYDAGQEFASCAVPASRDNPVRAIDAYVDSLDLNELGFREIGSDGGAGQPPYDPADLLRLYLYGYLHQVRSSRRLEREARRNVELMWLLRGLTPGYRTIANFRKDNAAGLAAANRDFVLLADRLDLLGGTLVAIDGAFFRRCQQGSILTRSGCRSRCGAGPQPRCIQRRTRQYQAEAAGPPEKRPRIRTSRNGCARASGGRRQRRFGKACRQRRWPDLAQ
jgi:transposase